jgi:hypothetical protein
MSLPTQRHARGRCLRALLLTLLLPAYFLQTRPAEGFFPTTLLTTVSGLAGTSHQRITEITVEELDAEFFGITGLTKSMKKAIEQIADANIEVDEDQVSSFKHFDGENFAGGQSFIIGNRSQIKPALQNNDAATARRHLGQVLHTIQDFYSHSNWVELGGGGPHPDVGVPGAVIGGAGPTEPTCGDCTIFPLPLCSDCSTNLITPRLTSGYYAGEDRLKPFAAKCSHGGPFDGSVTGAGLGINKDSFNCIFSPHADGHGTAVSVAREATKKFIRELKTDLSTKELKLLLGVGPNLAMAIDTTGSMGPIIAAVRAVAISIVDARLGTDEEPSKYVLTPFNDPFVGPTTITTEPDVFKSAISELGAFGGGDCPELSMNGMLQALSASDKGGDLFVFTDAGSKDGGLAGAVASLAASREIKIFPMTFGSCSPLDPVYIRIAEESGGQVFELLFSEAGRITQLADFLVRSNAVNVASIDATLSGSRSIEVPVDTTLTRVTFSLSGVPGLTLLRPDGSTVLATDAGVSFVPLSTAAIYSITDPMPGFWTAQLSGAGPVSLLVSGESALDLSSFRFVEERGRPGHEGFFPLPGLPLAGSANTVVAVISGGFSSVGFELRRRDGSLLQTLSLVHGPGQEANEFSGEVPLPDASFLVYAVGVDTAGQPFQRVLPASVRAQSVKVVPPVARTLVPGTSLTYTFKVQNVGAADDFRFLASDDQGFVRTITPSTFHLDGGGSIDVAVELQVPATATPGTSDTLTATVESTTASGARNFAVVVSSIGEGEVGDTMPPVIASLTASPAQLWPPNHKMHTIALALDVSDDQDPSPACQISAVSSDEPVKGSPDWEIGPGPLDLELRAEREGGGDGRVYTIEVMCTDVSGNSSQALTTVTVPHDQGH